MGGWLEEGERVDGRGARDGCWRSGGWETVAAGDAPTPDTEEVMTNASAYKSHRRSITITRRDRVASHEARIVCVLSCARAPIGTVGG